MATLLRERCRQHPEREAAARCSHCAGHFCRECVAEYDGRLACTACLRQLAGATTRRAAGLWRWALAAAVGLAGAWAWLLVVGQAVGGS